MTNGYTQSPKLFKGALILVKELVEHGAEPLRKNNYGVAPIDIARETGRAEIVALFEGKA